MKFNDETTSDASCNEAFADAFVHLNMIGRAPVFLSVLNQIKKIARCSAPVLIEGETGTGKELAARAIHYLGTGRDFPFIPVNCGAIPDSLMESELFGHKKGAFTDAKHSHQGLIPQSDGGTLFLDEVEVFSMKGQVALLRFLDDRHFRSVGGSRLQQASVRIIAASNAKLSDMVNQRTFRRDLYYRLNIMTIEMPALSARSGDIELLAEHFMENYRKQYQQPDKYLHPDALAWLNHYTWPGNVRELENMLHREFLLSENACIHLDQVSIHSKDRRKNTMDRRLNPVMAFKFNDAKKRVIDDFEKTYLRRLMKAFDGNVTSAAKHAGKERRALGKLLKKHNIQKAAI